jgi:hypothetical protein
MITTAQAVRMGPVWADRGINKPPILTADLGKKLGSAANLG